MKNLKIGKTRVGLSYPSFIVAELSGNHGGKISNALKLVRGAYKAGANAIKLQTYTADTITLNSRKKDFIIPANSPWKKNSSFWELYNKAHTPWIWHKRIFQEAKKLGMEIFSSPFDESAVDFLEKLNCQAYKIASPEINHLPLIEKIAKTGKPVIISTGLAEMEEIKTAIDLVRSFGNNKIIILKCTTSYPSELSELNLHSMKTIQNKFNTIVGFSDHSLGSLASISAVAIGAKVVEKHICLKNIKTVDDFFSLDINKFKDFVKDLRNVEVSLGKKEHKISKGSKKHLIGKRSIYISRDILKGEMITKNKIKVVRPNKSLHPKYYNKIQGMRAKKNFFLGDRIKLINLKK